MAAVELREDEGLAMHPEARGAPWEAMQGALKATSAAVTVIAYGALMWLMVAHHAQPRWDLYAAPMLLVLGGILLLTWGIPYRPRAALLLSLLFASTLLADLSSEQPELGFLYALVSLAAGVLLGPPAATLAGGLGTIALLASAGPSGPGNQVAWHLGAIWLTVGLLWPMMGGLFLAIWRAEAGEVQAWRRAQEARERRGELVRTQKALHEMYDLLQRANHELAIARQQAEEARQIKARFAANVSHELRTPLNLIMGFSEMMYCSPEVYGSMRWPPTLRADVREVYQASRHLLGMVDDILDLSRIEAQRLPLRLETTDLGELIRETVATSQGLLRGKAVELRVSLPEVVPAVYVDRTRIRQVLLNLLNNAIRFTDHGYIEVSASATPAEVLVAVADSGVGIPPDELELIFEEFRQVTGPATEVRGGAGLGLAICKQFVRLHGGRIEAESRVGQGSVFRFGLPLPGSGPAPAELFYYAPEGWAPPVPENPLGKTAIVLGADAEANASVARTLAGYRSLPVTALEHLERLVQTEHPAGIVLPNTETGAHEYEPQDVWRAAGRSDIAIVRCTARTPGTAPQELGVAGYLTKPIQRRQVVAAIKQISPEPRSLLLVDDDPGFVALLQRVLAAEFTGARVRGAYSGAEALAALGETSFDLVLLDLVMPGIDGLAVIEAMRCDPRLAGVPVLITTGTGYAQEAGSLRPGHVELVVNGSNGLPGLGRYISALLDVAAPDYSRPAPGAG